MIITILNHEQGIMALENYLLKNHFKFKSAISGVKRIYEIWGEFDAKKAFGDVYWLIEAVEFDDDLNTEKESGGTGEIMEPVEVEVDCEMIRNAALSMMDVNPRLKEAQAIMDLNEHTKSGLIDD
jgi:hypothetical protein